MEPYLYICIARNTNYTFIFQTDMVGYDINRFVHPDDVALFMEHFTVEGLVSTPNFAGLQGAMFPKKCKSSVLVK